MPGSPRGLPRRGRRVTVGRDAPGLDRSRVVGPRQRRGGTAQLGVRCYDSGFLSRRDGGRPRHVRRRSPQLRRPRLPARRHQPGAKPVLPHQGPVAGNHVRVEFARRPAAAPHRRVPGNRAAPGDRQQRLRRSGVLHRLRAVGGRRRSQRAVPRPAEPGRQSVPHPRVVFLRPGRFRVAGIGRSAQREQPVRVRQPRGSVPRARGLRAFLLLQRFPARSGGKHRFRYRRTPQPRFRRWPTARAPV